MTAENAVTVTQLNEYIRQRIDNDPYLSGLYLRGEISNAKLHSSGHIYMSLKDESSVIRAVMFRSAAAKLTFRPEDGLKVICRGRVSVFPRDGQYQFYIDSMEPDGVGAMYIALEQLKKKLAAEGLFSEARKKPLPKVPLRVGVVTSPTGAAVRDIINITGRRFPLAEIYLYPALVQGADAAPDLVKGVRLFENDFKVDVIIIGRGGGSAEDLWAFNDETLARTIAACTTPVISAVGHETDFTLCDFVADRRAPTPSAAAEIAVPDRIELKNKFGNIVIRLSSLMKQKTDASRLMLRSLSESRFLTDPMFTVNSKAQALDMAQRDLGDALKNVLSRERMRLTAAAAKLDALSPLSVVSRGYGMIFDSGGSVMKTVKNAKVGNDIRVELIDGSVTAKIESIEKGRKKRPRGAGKELADGKENTDL